jgi:hypothetical protein
MKHRVPQLPVQGEVPTGVVTQHLHRLPIRHAVQVLQDAHPEHQHRFQGDPPVVGAVALLQLGPGASQMGVNQFGEEPVAIGGRKQAGREPRRREELSLGRKGGHAHGWRREKAVDMWLVY